MINVLTALFATGEFQAGKPKPNNYKFVVFNNSWGTCKIINRYFKGQVLSSDENRKAGYFQIKIKGYKKPVAICYNDERIVKFI